MKKKEGKSTRGQRVAAAFDEKSGKLMNSMLRGCLWLIQLFIMVIIIYSITLYTATSLCMNVTDGVTGLIMSMGVLNEEVLSTSVSVLMYLGLPIVLVMLTIFAIELYFYRWAWKRLNVRFGKWRAKIGASKEASDDSK